MCVFVHHLSVCVCAFMCPWILAFIPTVYQHISLHLSVNLVNVASEPSQVTWSHHTEEDKETSTDRSRLILSLPKVYTYHPLIILLYLLSCSLQPVKQLTWHAKGDYFATVMPEGIAFAKSI